jgi:transcriptional regulator with XRE-family HTH domain
MSPGVSHEDFRRRVALVLERSGLTYSAFARKAGLDRSTLSQLLTAPMPRLPRAETLAAIARAAHVSVDWLLGLSQREEMGAEIIESVMRIEPYGDTPGDDAFLSWWREAHESRICTVPTGLPDILKTEDVLALEYADAPKARMSPAAAVRTRLDILRQPHRRLELATSEQSFRRFAAGEGRWSHLDAATRRAQLVHAAGLVAELYPAFRFYLFDADATSSVPFTVFGSQRVAIFLGTSYLVFNAANHIALFMQRFDDLIRAAKVQPHEVAAFLQRLADEVR